eukprot:SM000018S03673  [mRNA]  locus=s18:751648:753651:+ [translate_table: standard]
MALTLPARIVSGAALATQERPRPGAPCGSLRAPHVCGPGPHARRLKSGAVQLQQRGGGGYSGRGTGGALGATGALTESQSLAMGARAPHFELVEPLTCKTWTLEDFESHPALLVMFICNHCPYVVHLKRDIVALAEEYMRKGLAVVAISSNSVQTHPQDGPTEMAREAQELRYPFPYLFDETQEVARAYQAACTPDFYVFRKDGRRPFELAYHGQFDDSRPRSGRPVTGSDLRAALDCVLSSRPVSQMQRPSIGCSIKWAPQ